MERFQRKKDMMASHSYTYIRAMQPCLDDPSGHLHDHAGWRGKVSFQFRKKLREISRSVANHQDRKPPESMKDDGIDTPPFSTTVSKIDSCAVARALQIGSCSCRAEDRGAPMPMSMSLMLARLADAVTKNPGT